jgi:hypothetical protein
MEWLAHAATTHVPLALAVLFPVFYIGCLWATVSNWLPAKIWYPLWLLVVIQLGSLFFAFSSGERSEVLSAAGHEQIMKHEHLAVEFIAAWIGILVLLSVAILAKKKPIQRTAHVFLLAFVLAQIFIGIYLGKAGGAMVLH